MDPEFCQSDNRTWNKSYKYKTYRTRKYENIKISHKVLKCYTKSSIYS